MIVTFESPMGYQFQARPHDGGGWRIWKKPTKATGRNGKPIKAEWVALDIYPQTLERAVVRITEMILQGEPGELQVTCGDCIGCELKQHIKELKRTMGA